jgi:hypothetical protein
MRRQLQEFIPLNSAEQRERDILLAIFTIITKTKSRLSENEISAIIDRVTALLKHKSKIE